MYAYHRTELNVLKKEGIGALNIMQYTSHTTSYSCIKRAHYTSHKNNCQKI